MTSHKRSADMVVAVSASRTSVSRVERRAELTRERLVGEFRVS